MIGKPSRDTCNECGKFKYLAVKSKKLCTSCNNALKKTKPKKKTVKEEPKKKVVSVRTLIKKFDRVFSIYIRLRKAKSNGEVKCFTCDKKMHWRSSQCGHFMSRRFMSTRFHERNCEVQCYGCNIMMSGNQYIYGLRLDEEYGEGTAESMFKESKKVSKMVSQDLIILIKEYEAKIDDLRKKLGIWD
jgi:hypothetical protein